jgi:hypothetical protein
MQDDQEENAYLQPVNKYIREENLTMIKNESYNLKWTIFKICSFTIILISIIIANNINIINSDANKFECYRDVLFELTAAWNEYFGANLTARDIFLTFASLCVDLIIFSTIFLWVFVWKDWVLFISIALFYFTRGIFLALFQQRYPHGYFFDFPGFPSLTVSYLKTNDFYYSGHVGFPAIFILEYTKKINPIMVIVCISVILVEAVMMVILRGHYTIDLLFGVIAGFYVHKITTRYLHKPFFNFLKFIHVETN